MTQKTSIKLVLHKQFDHAQQAWFWALSQKENEKYMCTPQTICRIVDRLYRQRCLSLDHYRILYFYGMKQKMPCAHDPRQLRVRELWHEAMDKIDRSMRAVNLLKDPVSNVIPFDHYRFKTKGRLHG